MLKLSLILLILPIALLSQGAINNSKIESLKIYKINQGNKLSLSDTTIVYNQIYNDTLVFSKSSIFERLFEVAYPSLKIYNFLRISKHEGVDSSSSDGVRTYRYVSWCDKDTVDWETGSDGNIVYEIEYDNCRLEDIVKLNNQNRLLEYSLIAKGVKSTESYEYDDKGRLYKVNATKAKLTIYYDSKDRIDKIVEIQDNLGNLIETLGSSTEQEIEYKFEYN